MKKMRIGMFIVLLIIFASSFVLAEDEVIDPNIPDSWYEEFKTASELNIVEFNQSPMLMDKVNQGELSPIEERLPDDPAVIEPYENIGKYGGTITMWSVGSLLDANISYLNGRLVSAGVPNPRGELIPYYVKNWEYDKESEEFVLYLRKGVKWSDGHPMTADDYLYWWEHEATNKALTPTPPEKWSPPLLNVTKRGDWTVVFHYEKKPDIRTAFIWGMGPQVWTLPPSHFMKDFHPDFVGEEKVLEMAGEVGLDRWEAYYERMLDSLNHPDYEYQRPTLKPYIVKEKTETYAILERNPYFPFIDPEGNQLPYIDRIRNKLANNKEMAAMKATTGEATIAIRHVMGMPSKIPQFRGNEEKGKYKTLIYRNAGIFTVFPNLTHKDPELREIFQDVRFRKALSLGINRKEINDKIFFGEAIPLQATVNPGCDIYEEQFGNAYIDYKPEQAKELLDEMGMVDVNGDGYRETPDGKAFKPTLIYVTLWSATPILELTKKHWGNIGINVDLKSVSRELHDTRWAANEGDMSIWPIVSLVSTPDVGMLNAFAPIAYPNINPWPAWVNWYTSGGDAGMKPPEEIQKLVDMAEEAQNTSDINEGKKISKELLEIMSEKLWRIGVIGLWPRPIIIKNNLHNVPKTGILSADTDGARHIHPEQFYLEE